MTEQTGNLNASVTDWREGRGLLKKKGKYVLNTETKSCQEDWNKWSGKTRNPNSMGPTGERSQAWAFPVHLCFNGHSWNSWLSLCCSSGILSSQQLWAEACSSPNTPLLSHTPNSPLQCPFDPEAAHHWINIRKQKEKHPDLSGFRNQWQSRWKSLTKDLKSQCVTLGIKHNVVYPLVLATLYIQKYVDTRALEIPKPQALI